MMNEELKYIIEEAFICINHNVPLMTLFRKKPRFEEYITFILYLSTLNPSIKEKLGVFWIDEYTLALKTSNLARSIGLKPNSINCGLRQHQLEKVGRVSPEDIKDFDDKRNWKIMQDKQKLFTRTRVEEGGNHDLLKWIKPVKQIEKQKSTQNGSRRSLFQHHRLHNSDEVDDFYVDFDFEEKIESMFD